MKKYSSFIGAFLFVALVALSAHTIKSVSMDTTYLFKEYPNSLSIEPTSLFLQESKRDNFSIDEEYELSLKRAIHSFDGTQANAETALGGYKANTLAIMAPVLTVSNSTPASVDLVEGVAFTITTTIDNTDPVDGADSVYYCIENNMTAMLTSIEVGGMVLIADVVTLPGSSCFFIPGGLAASSNTVVTENWEANSCVLPTDDINRLVTYTDSSLFNVPGAAYGSSPTTLSIVDTDPPRL